MARIGILTGLKREAACLASLQDAEDPPLVRLSAARAEKAVAMSDELAASGVRGLVSFGFAGGLVSELATGMLVLPETVVDTSGGRWPVDAAWRAALAEHVPAPPLVDRAVGVNTAQMTSEAKAMVRAHTGAGACDMESHHVARAAQAAGLPFVVIRAVTDTYGDSVPEWTLLAIGETGALSAGALAVGIAAHIGDWGKLMRLGAASRGASAELRRLVAAAGPGLGFPGL